MLRRFTTGPRSCNRTHSFDTSHANRNVRSQRSCLSIMVGYLCTVYAAAKRKSLFDLFVFRCSLQACFEDRVMTSFFSDLRFGARLLRKAPITSAAAILSLALGIGGTTTMFSAVDAVLLRPLPFASPERLVLISATSPMSRGGSQTRRGGDLSPADFLDYRSASSFEGMASVSTNSMRLTGEGTPELVQGAQVSGNFFSLLGVNALAGRLFVPADDEPGRPAQAVVSEALWDRRYGRASEPDRPRDNSLGSTGRSRRHCAVGFPV